MKENIKYLLSLIALLLLFVSIGNIVMADETQYDMEVIDAKSIGIEGIENKNEIIEEEFINDDSKVENKNMDVHVQDSKTETPEKSESNTVPEGYDEGYVEGTYFKPNENDCEVCEECYNCEDEGHIYIHCVYHDEDSYVLEEWCEICGHGTEKVITLEKFDALGVETNVEF